MFVTRPYVRKCRGKLHFDEVGFDVGKHVGDKVRLYVLSEVDLYLGDEISSYVRQRVGAKNRC